MSDTVKSLWSNEKGDVCVMLLRIARNNNVNAMCYTLVPTKELPLTEKSIKHKHFCDTFVSYPLSNKQWFLYDIRQCADEVYTAEQYAKDHARMCRKVAVCSNCPICKIMKRTYGDDIDCNFCTDYVKTKPREVVAITRDWAREHPEPPEK